MTMSPSRSRARVTATAWLSAAVLVLAAGTALAPHASAAEPTSGTVRAAKSTDYVVAAGVTAVTVDMAGSIGKGGFCDQVAGFGGRTTATIPVTPGETLQINIGGFGFHGLSGGSGTAVAPCSLGGHGGDGWYGGGGGAGRWVPSTAPAAAPTRTGTRSPTRPLEAAVAGAAAMSCRRGRASPTSPASTAT